MQYNLYTPLTKHKPLLNKNILLAEDDMINALVASKFLKKWGANVEHVLNGKEVIDSIKSQKKEYHLLLLDVFMPIMDGAEASRHIRNEMKLNKHNLPIITTSAMLKSEAIKMTSDIEMNDCISKPFIPEELLEMILKHIR